MIKHYILMSSDYIGKTRISLDITDEKMFNIDDLNSILKKIKDCCGEDVSLSTHLIRTESKEWASVPAYDPFFKGVTCMNYHSHFLRK